MGVPLSIVVVWRSGYQVAWHLSLLKCCCRPSCERQADALLSKEFHQQFQLQRMDRQRLPNQAYKMLL